MTASVQAIETTREIVRENYLRSGRQLVWPEQLVSAGLGNMESAVEILMRLVDAGVLVATARLLSEDGQVLWAGPIEELPAQAEFPAKNDETDFGEGGVTIEFRLSSAFKNAVGRPKKNGLLR